MLSRPEMIFTISGYFKLKIQTQTKTFIHCPVSADRVYLQCLDRLQEWVPHTKTKKRVHIMRVSQMKTLNIFYLIIYWTR